MFVFVHAALLLFIAYRQTDDNFIMHIVYFIVRV